MRIKFFRSIWGMEEPTLEKKLKKIKQAGFDGVEMMVSLDKVGQNELKVLLRDLDLDLIASQWAAQGATFTEYLISHEMLSYKLVGCYCSPSSKERQSSFYHLSRVRTLPVHAPKALHPKTLGRLEGS